MDSVYNVFISWSGERSRLVAEKLRGWLPRVVQAAKPWMSDADIEKGSRGISELTKVLYNTKVGIVCLTPENLGTPWLLFEAGALSKAVDDRNRLCTYLLDGLKPENIRQPLGMFQATEPTKEDTRKLVRTINRSVSDDPLSEEVLRDIFEAMWPALEKTLHNLPHAEAIKPVRRSTEDMLAEILELLRGQVDLLDTPNLTPMPIGPIMEEAFRQGQKFLLSLLEHVIRWESFGEELRLYFPADQRSLAEMLQAQEPMEKLQLIASKAMGRPVRVVVELEGSL